MLLPNSQNYLRFFRRVCLTFVVGESQALMTTQEARMLSWKLLEMAARAERSGKPYPCLLLGICDSQPGRRHEEPGLYLAPVAVDSQETALSDGDLADFASPGRMKGKYA
jgi:hypothetical protein